MKRGKHVALYSRLSREFTQRFPVIAEAIARLPCRSATMHGESVPARQGGINFHGLRGARRGDDVSLL